MTKVIRFYQSAYHNVYGFFHKDSVYTDVPDDFKVPSDAEEISKDDINPEVDNVRTKDYAALTTAENRIPADVKAQRRQGRKKTQAA